MYIIYPEYKKGGKVGQGGSKLGKREKVSQKSKQPLTNAAFDVGVQQAIFFRKKREIVCLLSCDDDVVAYFPRKVWQKKKSNKKIMVLLVLV